MNDDKAAQKRLCKTLRSSEVHMAWRREVANIVMPDWYSIEAACRMSVIVDGYTDERLADWLADNLFAEIKKHIQ